MQHEHIRQQIHEAYEQCCAGTVSWPSPTRLELTMI